MKTIGVSTRPDEANSPLIKEQYYNFLKGLDVNILPLTYDEDIEKKLTLCDGFIIPGGADVNPSFYNQKNTHSVCYPESVDLADKMIFEYAKNNNLPLLGICRGMQVINVFSNGTLYQDILHHKEGEHEVYFDKNYKDIIDLNEKFITNSYHHQAIDKLGDDLIILAKSKDEVIEAIASPSHPIVALQWHPELIKDSVESQIILSWFIGRL